MDRKEFLKEFFKQVDEKFAVDLSKNKKGIQVALECLRKNKTLEESVRDLKDTYNLIEL